MNNCKMLLLTDAFSRRILAYALLLDEKHQKVETTLSNTDQTANVAGIKKAIAQYEITDTAHVDSSVEVEQGSAEAFSRRMKSYISRLDAMQKPDITCWQLV